MFFQGLRKDIGDGINIHLYTLWKKDEEKCPNKKGPALLWFTVLSTGEESYLGPENESNRQRI